MSPIFQVGGALPANHPTYVERRADQDALRAALNGEYLHVIAPRQVGKTSLLKRLADRLDKMGWHCVYLDLATLMDLPKPDWYAELGRTLAQSLTPDQVPILTNQIDLRDYLVNQALPCAGRQPRVALFLDEVEGAGKARDAAGRPFSDTFFSMFRTLYNERDKIDGTLIVALAGAVNPGDLVRDPDISPFNVGQEISLDDTSVSETRTLTSHLADLGLPINNEVNHAIYEWASGHPYLTQRICAELERAAQSGVPTEIGPGQVTQVVEEIILNPATPLQQDKNLKHVARMLSRLSAPAALLWSRLRAGESVSCKEATDDLTLELYLTGVVKAHAGRFVIRNRIYERAFTEQGQAKSPTAKTPKSEGLAMNRPIRVFISSTWQDLQPEREAVEKALHRMQDTAFAGMEYFGSRPETPKEVSLAEVDRSQVYIGIFAHRYGSGITEAEYRRAREQDMSCLIYLKDENVPVMPAHMERDPARAASLEALKHELKQCHTVSFYQNPDHLTSQIVSDLHNLLSSRVSVEETDGSRFGPKYQITITDSQGVIIGDGARVSQQLADFDVLSLKPRQNWGDETPPTTARRLSTSDAIDGEMHQITEGAVTAVDTDWLSPSSDSGGPSLDRTYLPTKLYSNLIGRDEKVRECLDSLRDPRAHPILGIFGFGGIGKTALAREIADQALTDGAFHAAFWMTAKRVSFEPDEVTIASRTEIGIEQILSEIVSWLGIQSELNSMRKFAEKQRRVKEILDASPSLLVLDNLETADEDQDEIVIELRKILGRSKAILTSREQADPRIELYRVQLAGLSESDSVKLMREVARLRGIERVKSAAYDQLAKLAEVVGGAPLALKLIVGLMATQDIELLRSSLESVKGQQITQMYRYLFLRSWRKLDELAVKIVFTLMHFGDGAAAKAVRLQAASELSAPELTSGIEQLTRLSLVEVGGEIDRTRYSFHPLFRNFISSDLLALPD